MRAALFMSAIAATLSSAALAATPTGRIYVGTNAGAAAAQVRIFDDARQLVGAVEPFQGFTGGVRVATGDVNGDGVADLVAGAGPGGGPHVKVFDGNTGAEIRSFFAYDAAFVGGVAVAAGDLDGDGRADLVTGAGPGGSSHVKAFSGVDISLQRSFFAFDTAFSGGVSVATGDFGGDGVVDLIAGAGPGGGPHVKVFDGATGAVRSDFFAFEANFTGGVSLATGRFEGIDALFVGAGAGGSPQVNIYNLADGRLLTSLLAFDARFDGGVNVGFARIAGRDTLLVGTASRGGTVGLFDVHGRGRDTADALIGAPSYFNPFGDSYMDGVSLAGVSAVPEPATWAQLILGFALAGLARRRVASRGALV